MRTYLERLFRSMRWADRQALGALRKHPAAQSEALPLLGHLLAAQHLWLARLEQRAARVPVWPALSAGECEALSEENEVGYLRYLARLAPDQLEAGVCRYRSLKGEDFETSVVDILMQVVLHGAYHRGQLAKCLAQAGGEVPNMDFLIYAREVESPRR
jgi:uncharacterized damage-inducible protein DinB